MKASQNNGTRLPPQEGEAGGGGAEGRVFLLRKILGECRGAVRASCSLSRGAAKRDLPEPKVAATVSSGSRQPVSAPSSSSFPSRGSRGRELKCQPSGVSL